MKKLSRNEWIATSAGVLFVGYMFFGGELSGFIDNFTNTEGQQANVMMNDNEQTKVQVEDLAVGNGKAIESDMQVAVNYILRLADGTIIQDSKQVGEGRSFKFIAGAGQLIPGWEQGILGMKVGGKRVITIPPELAYGSQEVGPIPANSTLIFEIEVVEAGLPN